MAFDPKITLEARPVMLPLPWPGYIHPVCRERMKATLAHGHWCQTPGPLIASLRLRKAPSEAVWLQCSGCGASVGSAMSKDQHPSWRTYPQWDDALAATYRAEQDAYMRSLPTLEDRINDKLLAFQKRRDEYRAWCRTSDEWAEAKKRAMWRSRGYCEACLTERADTVHHLTYEHGKIPPMWELRAVCTECHERLHDGDDEWCDWGMAR